MTKNEFMARLANELHRRNVADAADVAEEYEQHFAFKLADGYLEEEIAVKLGVPEELAAQFGETDAPKRKKGSKPLVVMGLGVADLFAACIVLTYVVCTLSAGSFQFWHTWGWFLN